MKSALPHAALDERRRRLGMSYAALAKRSQVSLPTVVRILSGRNPDASFAKVLAIAEALGMTLRLGQARNEDSLRKEQARKKAAYLVGMVQGTSGLEGQAVSDRDVQRMVRNTTCDLLASRSRRVLWGD